MDPVQHAKRLDEEFTASCAVLNRDEPWFGEFALKVNRKMSVYKVGGLRSTGQRIIPATHPLAQAFYECEPGDPFELDSPELAQVSGKLAHKSKVASRARRIQRVDYSDVETEAIVLRTDHGFEVRVDASRGVDAQTGLPNILALLTRDQYRLISQLRSQPVIIQGRAGSGKTSVALYRVAWLANPVDGAAQPAVDPSRVLIVMFNKALSMFVRAALPGLHLEKAVLDTFHGWALDRVKRAYKGTLRIDTSDLPGKKQGAPLKKSIGVLRAIDEFVESQNERVGLWLREKLTPYKGAKWMERFRELKLPMARRLIALRSEALVARDAAKGVQRQRLTQVHAVFEQAVKRVTQYKEELSKVLTDRDLLGRHMKGFRSADIDALVTYQKALSLREGSERRPGPCIGFEDLALLLRLIQLKNGGLPGDNELDPVDLYDHLVIDEAQDFGAVELTVLLQTVRARTGVTIAGDTNQKIVPEAEFMGWDALARELGIQGARASTLEVAHRATEPIMRVADSLVGDETTKGRLGPTPTLTITDTDEGQLDRAGDLIRGIVSDHPSAHVCVVTCHAHDAQPILAELSTRLSDVGISPRLGHNDKFVFGPGVTVTNMRQVKGLEFDAVIALDANATNYPSTDQGRRNLYMLLTRAKDRLDIVCVGDPSTLLGDAIQAGAIEVIESPTIAPVTFTEEEEEPV